MIIIIIIIITIIVKVNLSETSSERGTNSGSCQRVVCQSPYAQSAY